MGFAQSGSGEQLFALAERIESSAVGTAIAESRYLYAIIEGVHLIGLTVAVGLLFVIDLRLIGAFLRTVPVSDLLRQLRPWVFAGFGLIVLTGGLLFWSSATEELSSPPFAIKMGLVALGALNALYFELVSANSPAVRGNHAVLPWKIRFAGAASLAIWTLVIVAGRLIPYLPRW